MKRSKVKRICFAVLVILNILLVIFRVTPKANVEWRPHDIESVANALRETPDSEIYGIEVRSFGRLVYEKRTSDKEGNKIFWTYFYVRKALVISLMLIIIVMLFKTANNAGNQSENIRRE